MKCPPSRLLARSRSLNCEALEKRLLMTASVELTPAGVLNIQGDAEPNRIYVALSPSGERMRVQLDGRSEDFAATDVQAILIHSHRGNDVVRIDDAISVPAQIFGGEGNDRIVGGSGSNLIHGGAGNDSISGGRATDYIFGGDGNDSIRGGAGDDYLIGGGGNDRIDGGLGDDWLFGDATNELPDEAYEPTEYAALYADTNSGNDILLGGAGQDFIYGGQGNDLLRGGLGRDLLVGGPGQDIIDARDRAVDIVLTDGEDRLLLDRQDLIFVS